MITNYNHVFTNFMCTSYKDMQHYGNVPIKQHNKLRVTRKKKKIYIYTVCACKPGPNFISVFYVSTV